MKTVALLFLLFMSDISFAQSKRLSKQDLLNVLHLTIDQKPRPQNNNSCSNGLCGEWWSPNKDNQFYKSDTVRFYNSSNFYSVDSSCCSFKIWEFGKKNKFSRTGAEICNEPPLRTFEGPISFDGKKHKRKIPNKFNVFQKNGLLFIETLMDNVLVEKYKVINIQKNDTLDENAYILTLVRQK